MIVPIKLLHPAAKPPIRANPSDAGYDLCCLEEVTLSGVKSTSILPDYRAVVSTGISVAIPDGFYGRIAPRSGLAAKYGIDILAGVVDSSFRGEIKVVLINLGNEMVTLLPGQRVAQLIIEKCHEADWEVVDKLPETQRGATGFGASGK